MAGINKKIGDKHHHSEGMFGDLGKAIMGRVDKVYAYFFNDPKKVIGVAITVVVIIMAFSYWRYTVEAENVKAAEVLSKILVYYNRNEFEKSIKGDIAMNIMGLGAIVESFDGTPSGNQARLYLGNAYMKLGKLDEAFTAFDGISKRAGSFIYAGGLSGKGAYYSSKKEYEKAAESYWNAAESINMDVFIPIYLEQAALNYSWAGNQNLAIELFEKIKKKYPDSEQARDADLNMRYIKN